MNKPSHQDASGPRGKSLHAILAYGARGWPVVPLHTPTEKGCSCGRPDCSSPGKHPRIQHGLKDATTDEATIQGWWKRWPEANVGIVTGALSGLVVIDQDGPDAEKALRDKELPATPCVRTGKGLHRYFAYPGVDTRRRIRLLPEVDLLGEGGYVVAPPSLHPSGHHYEWVNGFHHETLALAPCPAWLVSLARKKTNNRPSTPSVGETIPEGRRNATLTSLAGTMRNRGMGEEAILAALKEENAARCRPLLPNDEVCRIARSIIRYTPMAAIYHPSDLGNAELLVELFGNQIRYVHLWRRWLIWDEQRWVPDLGGGIDRLVSLAVRERLRRAAELEDQKERKKEVAWAITSEAANRKSGALDWARSQPGVPILPKDLDADPWLLNVQNGTIELRTGKLRPHDPADLITKLAPVEYDPDVTSLLWASFLDKITGGDDELKGFLQRTVGYSLTGDTSEEILFFVQGPTNTGKSSFIEGDYGPSTGPVG